MTDDAASLVQPSDQELADYLAAHPDKFRQSPTYTFEQVYFNPEKHTEAEVAEELSFLREGKQVGDVSLLPPSFKDAIDGPLMGRLELAFRNNLDQLQVGDWQGPIRSGLGYHLIKIQSRSEGQLPSLDQVRPIVEREWSNDKRLEIRKQINDRLLKEYEITVEWPD